MENLTLNETDLYYIKQKIVDGIKSYDDYKGIPVVSVTDLPSSPQNRIYICNGGIYVRDNQIALSSDLSNTQQTIDDTITEELAKKSNTNHTHTITDITDLNTKLSQYVKSINNITPDSSTGNVALSIVKTTASEDTIDSNAINIVDNKVFAGSKAVISKNEITTTSDENNLDFQKTNLIYKDNDNNIYSININQLQTILSNKTGNSDLVNNSELNTALDNYYTKEEANNNFTSKIEEVTATETTTTTEYKWVDVTTEEA